MLVAYYYGNITSPLLDPPKVGLLSTVPADVASQLQQAIQAVLTSDGQFPSKFCSQTHKLDPSR